MDYFELEALEKQQLQQELLNLPFSSWKAEIKMPMCKKCSLYQENGNISPWRIKVKGILYKQTLLKKKKKILSSSNLPHIV